MFLECFVRSEDVLYKIKIKILQLSYKEFPVIENSGHGMIFYLILFLNCRNGCLIHSF